MAHPRRVGEANAAAVRRIARAVEPLRFERIYGAWLGRNIRSDAKAAFKTLVRRYPAAISDQADRTPGSD